MVSDSTFTEFGEEDWDDLISIAMDVTSLGTTVTNTEPVTNVDHGGDLKIQSSSFGQGTLLVEGDLLIQGGYTFYGLIIVQGSFSTAGSGARIIGSVLAGNATLNDIAGSSVIQSRSGQPAGH